MGIAQRIREAREVKSWSQAELAAMTGVTRGACGHWEQGKTVPSVENLSKIAMALGVRFEWLATGRGPRDFDLAVAEEAPNMCAFLEVPLDRESREVLDVFSKLSPVSRRRLLAFLRSIPVCSST